MYCKVRFLLFLCNAALFSPWFHFIYYVYALFSLSWFPAAATLYPLYTISTSTSLSIYELLFGFRLANVYLYFRLDSTASFRLVWICLFSLALHNTRLYYSLIMPLSRKILYISVNRIVP